MQGPTATPAASWRGLKILYWAILGSHLMAGAAIGLVAANMPPILDAQAIAYGLLLVPLGVMAAAFVVSGALVAKAKAQPDLLAKLAGYRGALILRWAMLEGSFMTSLMFYLITKQPLFFATAGLGLIVYLSQSPSLESASSALGLDTDERSQLTASSTETH